MKLQVEWNENTVKDPSEGEMIMITPPIGDKNYWLFRVKLFEDQYLQCFPKFMTIGIGFAIEDDWNCNLPYTQNHESIRKHIWHNRRYIAITKSQVNKAILLLQNAIEQYLEKNNGNRFT